MMDPSPTASKKKVPREYQTISYETAKTGNTIINLDTGLGKTLIACLLIENELSSCKLSSYQDTLHKLIIFLAPQVPLVEQQARVIAHEVPNAIVRKLHGQMHLSHNEWTSTEWHEYLSKGGNVFVMTPSIFNNMLIHGHIYMNNISLIIFDECHHISSRDEYRLIMEYHYNRCMPISQRPKIFGMSAPLIKGTSNIHRIRGKINELSNVLNCNVFHPKSKDINKYLVSPNVEYITYKSYTIDPSKFEYIWPCDPGLNEEKWEKEQDHFYRVLDELGERAAVIALDMFIKTDETNIYLHRFPMEKIIHDQLLKKEFQINFDYQNKKKILKKNWRYWKKRYVKTNDNNNKIYDDDLKLNEPIQLQTLFNNNNNNNNNIDDQSKNVKHELNISEKKPKYCSKSSKKVKPKRTNRKKSNREKLEEWIETLNNPLNMESELRYFSLSPKCIALFNILYNELERVGKDGFKTLILVQRRKVAQILSILINQSPLPIVSDFLISSICKGGAMNAKISSPQQKDRLNRFYITDVNNCDRIDILVATSLLEEGLDVPSCKLVIKFNETVSSKQDVQCKGRARHFNSRYIHLIHEHDERRQTEKLKKYKTFQQNVEQEISEKKQNEKQNKKSGIEESITVLDPYIYERGLYIEATHAFIFEKVALLKIHEIYNRHDFDLNCDVPWESFAESPFSKHNFEQSIYCGVCGVWKVEKFVYNGKMIDNENARVRIKRVKDSDELMEGVFYITNDVYKQQIEQYRMMRAQQRKYNRDRNRHRNGGKDFEYVLLPELPDRFGEVRMKYKNANEIEVKFMGGKDDCDSGLKGVILEDRNGIIIGDGIELKKIETVNKLNKDPNAYACNYKLVLKLRDIPKSFIDNITQKESAKQWVNNKLNMDKICNMLSIEKECIQKDVRIINDTAISFMLCLWRKKQIENDENICNNNNQKMDKSLVKTTKMLSNMKDQINSDQCDWHKLDKIFINNLIDQFKEVFGDDSRIYINKTESKFLQITTHKLPHYIRDRNKENDIPVWVKQKCKNIKFNDNKYTYELTTFQECFLSKRSIRCDFNISGIRLEKTEFEDRLELLRKEFVNIYGFIHLYLPGQSNWKKSDKKKNSSYKYDKLYQQKVILPKLSEFYNHLPQTTIIGDIRFNFKSARDSVAFKAIKFLYLNGVLDDNLRVIGRRKAPRPMSMMGTNCCVMETIYYNAMKPKIFEVSKTDVGKYIDYLHCIQFIDNDTGQILYEWGLLLSGFINYNIIFYIYPQDINWINIDGLGTNNKQLKKWKVRICFISEHDRTVEFDDKRLCYHTNLMSLLGYNDSVNYNCTDKNCVIIPLNNNNTYTINLNRIDNILLNPWSQFVNIDIMFLWGKKLTIEMINKHKNEIISLISQNNENIGHSKCRIDLIEQINELPCVTPNIAQKWNIDENTNIIMIKFVTTINGKDSTHLKLHIPNDPEKTLTWDTINDINDTIEEKKDEKKPKTFKCEMSKAESLQRTGFHIQLKTEKLKKVLSYPLNDLRYMINHRDEVMIQSHEWVKLNDKIIENNGIIDEYVVRNNATSSYYTDLKQTNLCLKDQIGAGFSYLDCIKNRISTRLNELNENELLYSAAPLPLRPEDATIKHNIKLKKNNKIESGLLIAPQMCNIVPVSKKELFFSRYLCCSLWKFEQLLIICDFKHILEQYIGIQYNIYLLYQCCSLPSIDMILHSGIGRIYFFGDQIIKYCASIEAYLTRNEFNEIELTRFVHHTVSNNNLCDKTKQHKYLKYLILKEFDAKKYEITNFSIINDDNDYYRISRKSIADIIEGMLTATFYNDYIMSDKNLRDEIIDKPIGQMEFNYMKIGNWMAMCQCREFIIHLLQFKHYEQPHHPIINIDMNSKLVKYAWNNKTVFICDYELQQILNILNQIKKCMIHANYDIKQDNDNDNQYDIIINDNNNNDDEKKEEKKKEDEFEWSAETIEMLSHIGIGRNSTGQQIEDIIFEIHDNCISNQWDIENLKWLSLLNKVRNHIKKQEKLDIINLKPKKEIYIKNVYEYGTNGLDSIAEEYDEEKYNNDYDYDDDDEPLEKLNKKPLKPNKNIFIPSCIKNNKLGYNLYENILKFYNKHCILSEHECIKYLLNFAIYKCISHLFVCQYDNNNNLKLFYKNDFTLRDIEEVINKFNILCDDTFPIFVLIDQNRINNIEKILNYTFDRKDLLFIATTHSAFNIDNKSFWNYQRLEFIGDASIGICVTQYLFQTFVKFEQGRLSHTRAALVCNHYLARKLMRRFKKYNLDIKKYITIISNKDRNDLLNYCKKFDYTIDDFEFCLNLLTVSKIKQPYCAKIFADVYESLIGAVLIDTEGNLEMIWDIIKDDFKLNESHVDLINKKYAESQMIQDQLSRLMNN